MIQPAPVERVLRARDHVTPLEDVGGQRLSHDIGDRVLGRKCNKMIFCFNKMMEPFISIPSMIKMLNNCQRKKSETFKKLDNVPVNYVLPSPYH